MVLGFSGGAIYQKRHEKSAVYSTRRQCALKNKKTFNEQLTYLIGEDEGE